MKLWTVINRFVSVIIFWVQIMINKCLIVVKFVLQKQKCRKAYMNLFTNFFFKAEVRLMYKMFLFAPFDFCVLDI